MITTKYRDTHPELPLDPDAVQPGRYKRPIHLTLPLQLLVFSGGCFGALARYGATLVIPAHDNSWPLATFVVNIAGALLLGALLEALERRGKDKGARRLLRLGIGTGFIGAFTTYSTLAVEVDLLTDNGRLGLAIAYALISVIAGILASMLGIQIAGAHHKRQTGKAL